MIRLLALGVVLLGLFAVSAPARAQAPAVLRSDPDASGVRGLPLCTTWMTLPQPGSAYTCRPQWHGTRNGPTLELSWLGLGPAGIEATRPLAHSAFVVGGSVTLWVARELGIAADYTYVAAGPREVDVDLDHRGDTARHSFNGSIVSASLRLRLFSDEVNQEAWLFEAGGGWLVDHDAVNTRDGAVAQIAIGRQIGGILGLGGAGFHVSLLLAGTQGFGDAQDFRLLSVVLRLGQEYMPREPLNMDQPWHTASFDYVFGGRVDLVGVQAGKGGGTGVGTGFALAFGLPFERMFEPRVEAGFFWLGTFADRDVPLVYTTTGGIRLRLTEEMPLFVQLMGGWEFSFGTIPKQFDDGPIVEVSTGLYVGDCRLGGAFGFRYVGGVGDHNGELQALMVFAELDYGSRSGSLGDRRRTRDGEYRCDYPHAATVPTPPTVR